MSKKVSSPIPNPWLNIGWNLDRVAGCDKSYLASWPNSKYIQMNTLPEPYTGDVDSDVYCLNLNPGAACITTASAPKLKKDFEDYTQQTLRHSIKDNMWLLPLFQGTAGYTWWQQKTKWLRDWLQKNKNRQDPRMFVIEYFPYHTPKGMKFPVDLPSYAYSDQLILQAMAADKYIIIMRHWNEWLKRIPELKTYGKLARLKNPQNPCLTAKNIDTLGNFPLGDLLNAF